MLVLHTPLLLMILFGLSPPCTGRARSKHDQRRGYKLWAASSFTSGTEYETRVQTIFPVASFVLAIHLQIEVFVLHGFH
jgi:hypothetical protein